MSLDNELVAVKTNRSCRRLTKCYKKLLSQEEKEYWIYQETWEKYCKVEWVCDLIADRMIDRYCEKLWDKQKYWDNYNTCFIELSREDIEKLITMKEEDINCSTTDLQRALKYYDLGFRILYLANF